MEKPISKRSSKLLAAAVASVGLAGIGTSQPQAHGGIVVDLRATYVLNSPNYNNSIPFANPKQVFANIGDTVLMNVVVRVSGTDGVQQIGDWDSGGGLNDTRNNDALQILVGGFSSTGTLKGNFNNTAHGGQVAGWVAYGSTNGVAQDFDSDGDLDLGAIGTDSTNMWAARAAGPSAATVSVTGGGMIPVVTRFGFSSGSAFTEDTGGQLATRPPTTDLIINNNSADLLLGELLWVVTGGAFTAFINFVPRANGDAGALWFEDGIGTGKNGTNSTEALGAPVIVEVPYPEPTTLSLLGLASPGLLARRRNTRFRDAGIGGAIRAEIKGDKWIKGTRPNAIRPSHNSAPQRALGTFAQAKASCDDGVVHDPSNRAK